MINVNYGSDVSAEMRAQIVKLLSCGDVTFDNSISEDDILKIVDGEGDKVINVATGETIEEASRYFPNNSKEVIDQAAVIIKVTPDYQFHPTALAPLIKYFDAYPMDPKIAWAYCYVAEQEDPVNIIILKLIKSNKDETI